MVKYSSCSMLKLSSPIHAEGKDSRLFADAFRYLRLTTASAKIRLHIIQTTPLTPGKGAIQMPVWTATLDRRPDNTVTSLLTLRFVSLLMTY